MQMPTTANQMSLSFTQVPVTVTNQMKSASRHVQTVASQISAATTNVATTKQRGSLATTDQISTIAYKMSSTQSQGPLTTNNEPPGITCVADKEIGTDLGKSTAAVEWQTPTIPDISGDIISATCSPESGTNFTIGQSIITCEAFDMSGNRAACSFNVSVAGT